jgi:DNA-binding CsgD family transcriptional regulator
MACHKCNNPQCVNPSHIEPGDQLENMADRVAAGHYTSGENHPMAKLSNKQVAEVRGASGTYKEIADHFGISLSQVGNIKRGDQRV